MENAISIHEKRQGIFNLLRKKAGHCALLKLFS
jgi:hypothetical protein